MDPSFIGCIEFQPAYDVGVIFEALASACARLQQKGQRAQTIGWFTMMAETCSVPSARRNGSHGPTLLRLISGSDHQISCWEQSASNPSCERSWQGHLFVWGPETVPWMEVCSRRRCKRHRTNLALATARMSMKMVPDMCSWRAANLRKWTPSCWTRWKLIWEHEMQRDFAKSSVLLVDLYYQIHPEMLENHERLFVALGQGN